MKFLVLVFPMLLSSSAYAAHPWAQFAGCYKTTEWNGVKVPGTGILDKVLDQSFSTFYYDIKKVDIPSVDFLIFNPGDGMTHFSSAFEDRGDYTQSADGFKYVYEGDVVSGFYYEVVHLKQELSISRKSESEIKYTTKIVTLKNDGQVIVGENSYLLKQVNCH
jgi:hypothetical protein